MESIVNSQNIDEYADLIVDYLDQFKPRFISDIKQYDKKIEEYIKTTNKCYESKEIDKN